MRWIELFSCSKLRRSAALSFIPEPGQNSLRVHLERAALLFPVDNYNVIKRIQRKIATLVAFYNTLCITT